jgi:uncharacterized membrane protein YjgN (DUF898 family)
MPESVTCTECGAKLKMAALPAPGKKIRCPKCGEPFFPERPDEDDDRDERPLAKTRPRRNDDDDYEAPRKKGGRAGRGFEFDGSGGDFFVVYLLSGLLTIVTLGIGFPWAICMIEGWKAEHTIIEGRRLQFTGSGLGLFGTFIVCYLLTFITLGIYMFWAVPKIIRWTLENTSFAD